MRERDQLVRALGGLDAGDPRRAEHVALGGVAACHGRGGLGRHAHDRARPGAAVGLAAWRRRRPCAPGRCRRGGSARRRPHAETVARCMNRPVAEAVRHRTSASAGPDDVRQRRLLLRPGRARGGSRRGVAVSLRRAASARAPARNCAGDASDGASSCATATMLRRRWRGRRRARSWTCRSAPSRRRRPTDARSTRLRLLARTIRSPDASCAGSGVTYPDGLRIFPGQVGGRGRSSRRRGSPTRDSPARTATLAPELTSGRCSTARRAIGSSLLGATRDLGPGPPRRPRSSATVRPGEPHVVIGWPIAARAASPRAAPAMLHCGRSSC